MLPWSQYYIMGEAGPKGGIQYRFGIGAKNSGRPKNCSDPVLNRTDIL